MIYGSCKECGTLVSLIADRIPDCLAVYECPECYYPSNMGDFCYLAGTESVLTTDSL